jgi:thiol-disulfide isomerase/thioredoxin
VAAEKARDYCTRFPDSTNLLAAKTLECKMRETAYNLTGDEKLLPAVLSAEHDLLADARLAEDSRFNVRVKMARFQAQAREYETSGAWTNKWSAFEAEYERQIRALIKDYPHREKAYTMLVNFGANAGDAKARAIATEILGLPVSSNVLVNAQGVLRGVNAVGKPPEIQFTAVDGRMVDVSQMKGKVVLVDFWATWCGPCVGEIPNVKAVYKKLHAQGFDVVGISFDGNKKDLEQFVKKQDLPWPQYFDGTVWDNKFGVQYGIKGIPAMWLVDKQGNVREQNAREDLMAKVEKLLAE